MPVLVEAERLRPGLDDLLAEADCVVTSAHFPQVRRSFSFRACAKEAREHRMNQSRRYGSFTSERTVRLARASQDWTGEAVLEDALLATAARLPRASFLITTLGTRGSVLLERAPPSSSPSSSATTASSEEQGEPRPLADVVRELQAQLAAQAQEHQQAGSVPDCVTADGRPVR